MPGLVPGIHVLAGEDVDGRDKPAMTERFELRGFISPSQGRLP